jgi:drug/metabolite transporter (DMT)-like permease
MIVFVMTSVTMLAFASNSLLTRWAVEGAYIDASAFALIRVLSGAVFLALIVRLRGTELPLLRKRRVVGALSLAAYAVGFTFAYQTLDAGLGALILFGVVQISMFFHGYFTGLSPTRRQVLGAGVAFFGLTLALWPGSGGQADFFGSSMMIAAGIGWAVYTISGRASSDPLPATAANFILCFPVLLPVLAFSVESVSATGILLAVICGGVTSGLGYTLWYSVLPALQQSVAAVVQLSVPVIALTAGALFLGEPIAPIVAVATLLVLGGIGIAVTSRSFPKRHS